MTINNNTSDSRALIFEYLRRMSVLFERNVSTQKLELYARMLTPFGAASVRLALEQIVFTAQSASFPPVGHIISVIKGDGRSNYLKATQASSDIIQAVLKLGPYKLAQLPAVLTPEQLDVLDRFGGARSILHAELSDMNTIRAQLRDLYQTCIEASQARDAKQLLIKQRDQLQLSDKAS